MIPPSRATEITTDVTTQHNTTAIEVNTADILKLSDGSTDEQKLNHVTLISSIVKKTIQCLSGHFFNSDAKVMFKKVFYVDVFLYPHDDWQKSLHTKKLLIGFWFDNLATSVCIWIKIFVLSDWVQEQHYETFPKISPSPEKNIPSKNACLKLF